MYADAGFSKGEKKIECNNVPAAYVEFSAHSSPLGFEYFDSRNDSPALKDSFLVALHGSSKRSLKRGYSLMRVRKGGSVQDFITGFLQTGRVYGRPADVMSMGKNLSCLRMITRAWSTMFFQRGSLSRRITVAGAFGITRLASLPSS